MGKSAWKLIPRLLDKGECNITVDQTKVNDMGALTSNFGFKC